MAEALTEGIVELLRTDPGGEHSKPNDVEERMSDNLFLKYTMEYFTGKISDGFVEENKRKEARKKRAEERKIKKQKPN